MEVAKYGDDRGAAERWQHDRAEAVDVLVQGELRRTVKVVGQIALDRYRRRGEIDEAQWQAADRLRRDFHFANLQPRLTAVYAERNTGSSDDWSERRMVARDRYVAAVRAVGPVLSPVLMHVACLDGKASDWAAAHNHRGRRAEIVGMTALQLALDALVLHYRGRGRHQGDDGPAGSEGSGA